jgi:ADP-ribose pyrophosphatase YjhB (NUDIX family)
MLTAEAEAEIAELARRFGVPRRWRREYEISSPESEAWAKKMLKRPGEVVLVVPLDDHRVWLHTKQFYPAGVYRLPSGGIHDGEGFEAAARRETYEEMGFVPELSRFMGVVENVFAPDGETVVYPTYVLETKPMPGSPRVTDPDEAISGFREIYVQELPKITEQLDSLAPNWQPWGHFRAAPHARVAEALQDDSRRPTAGGRSGPSPS